MSRHRLIALCLIAAMVLLRFAGAHMHVHNHADDGGGAPPPPLQFSESDDHGDTHEFDIDVDLLNASVLKKPGPDYDQPLLLALLLIMLLSSLRGTSVLPRLRPASARAAPCRTLPPSRAPPA